MLLFQLPETAGGAITKEQIMESLSSTSDTCVIPDWGRKSFDYMNLYPKLL